ncbi:MAG: GGDEF domain-containing protein, partial [Eubacterium sp.]
YGIEGKLELEAAMGEGSEAAGFLELLQLLQRRMDQKEEKLAGQAAYQTHQSIQFSPAVMDDAPEHICLVDPENDDVVYMNNTMKRALNLPQDFKCYGHRCYELLLNRTSPCPDCTVRMLPLDTVISRHQRFGADDKDFVTREMLVHWKDRLLRMSIGFASDENGSQLRNLLSDETWAGEAITSGMAEKNPDLGLQKTVNKVGWNLQAERLLVFEESDDGTVSCSYEWFIPDYPAQKEELQSILIGKLAPLYRMFQTDKVVTIPDYTVFQQEHPEFWLPGVNIRNVISGHLESSGKSLGFTLVLNVLDQNFHEDSHILSTLTDFLAIMMQYRNSIRDALEHSMRDPLTGVLNRSGLARYLKTRKLQETAAVFSADINGLKTVNDLHGHLAGDRLIRTITDILVNVSDKDHVVRMGGDEFLMIREGMDETAADDLILQIRDICRVKGVSMALGYTIHTGAIDDMDEILRAADKAMYEDKGRYYHRRSTDR